MSLRYAVLWIVTTALRLFPWPARPGLRSLGRPDDTSPVLLTCNFALTVARLEWALRGVDAWLLVANSRGINVWCAAAGGHLTTHEAVSVLKTTGVADRVSHRRVILPQLAATGIEADLVRERAGWEVVWGPVDAGDLPAFLKGEEQPEMRHVRFSLFHRLEMAVMWAAPLSLLALFTLLFRPGALLPLLGIIWGTSLTVYLSFPLYERLVFRPGTGVGKPTPSALASFSRFVALFGGLVLAGVGLYGALQGRLSWSFVLGWGGAGLLTVLMLAFDLAGSTPLYKSWTHAERLYTVKLDPDLCIACDRCATVCPRAVFVVDGIASLPHADRCEQCGACIVQCPTDALSFLTPDGKEVGPQTVRRYKLNLMGQRPEAE